MDATAIEQAIKDCGVPGRLVALEGRLIRLDILDENSESLERRELGLSEFCDLVLDWRARIQARQGAARALRQIETRVPAESAA
ncbi:MAG: hypothetical protein ACYDGR_11860 [Candidatus Dormibacteria bacterium]